MNRAKSHGGTTLLHDELLSDAPVGTYRTDEHGIPSYLDTEAKQLLGVKTGLPPDKWFDLIHPKDRERVQQAWQKALEQRTRFHQEYRVGSDPLTQSWLVDIAHYQHDSASGINGYVGTLVDITDLRLAQAAEQDLQEHLRVIIDASHVGLWDMNIQTNEIWYSPEWKRQVGCNDDELANTFNEWKVRLHPADAEEAMDALQRFIRYPETDLYSEYRMRHKNGSYRWILSQARMQFDAGRPARILGSHIDITRTKEHETQLRKSREHINHLLEASPTILYSMRVEHKRLYPSWVSKSIQRLLGFTTAEAIKPDWWIEHLHPDDRARVFANNEQLFENGSIRHEYRFYDKQGNIRWVRDSLRLIPGDDGMPREAIGTWMDVTEQHYDGQRMQVYTTAFNSISDGILTLGTDMTILSCNKAASEIFGYSANELIGSNLSLFRSNRHPPSYFSNIQQTLHTTGSWRGEVWNRHKDDSVRPHWLNISIAQGEDGLPDHYVAIYTDISELKEKEAKLIHQAHYDGLTELPNRLLLAIRLQKAIEESRSDNRRFAVLFMDLDAFRSVNDSMGHTLGDELLVAVARRLSLNTHAGDTLARLGGDEFALLGRQLLEVEDAEQVACNMLSPLAAPFALSNSMQVYVEACIGIAVYPDSGTTVEALMRNADTAMYRAKGEGRNNYRFHTEEMTVAIAEQLELETALRQALARNQLLLHYQPKADLRSGQMTGLEALIRWQSPEHGLVPPDRFIPIAERSGLINPIGEWVLRSVCQQIRSWLDQGLNPVNIAVNVSTRQFRTNALQTLIGSTLQEFDIPPHLLCLEITESTLMDNPEEAGNILRNLKSTGVRIALDDFGTGYSNMAYLSHFPLDELKIDASFIKAIGMDSRAPNLVDSIINIATNLRLKTVAEGVETQEQIRYLRRHACDEMQGYYFSTPLSAEELTRWLHCPAVLRLPEDNQPAAPRSST